MATTLPRDYDTILRALAAELKAWDPADADRIARAVALVQAGYVEPPVTSTQWLVRSAADLRRAYTVTNWTCSCADHTTRERRCKHSYAVILANALHDELRFQARVAGEPIPFTLAPKAYSALQPPQPWPAPSDVEWHALCDAHASEHARPPSPAA